MHVRKAKGACIHVCKRTCVCACYVYACRVRVLAMCVYMLHVCLRHALFKRVYRQFCALPSHVASAVYLNSCKESASFCVHASRLIVSISHPRLILLKV